MRVLCRILGGHTWRPAQITLEQVYRERGISFPAWIRAQDGPLIDVSRCRRCRLHVQQITAADENHRLWRNYERPA